MTMNDTEEIILKLINSKNAHSNYTLHIDKKSIQLESVQLNKTTFPVKKPDTRGGVYFSNMMGYKIKGVTKELSLIPSFTKAMLGPNTEFSELEIKTKLIENKKQNDLVLLVNLTNTVQKNDQVELHMNIVGLKILD